MEREASDCVPRPHPWDALCRATLITEEQLALIKHYDVDNPMQQDQLMEQVRPRTVDVLPLIVSHLFSSGVGESRRAFLYS